MAEKKTNIALVVVILVVIFGFLILLIAGIVGLMAAAPTGNVALIKVEGVILTAGDSPFTQTASSTQIVRLIEKADKSPLVEAIIFEINSPGGSAVASDEIGTAIKKTNKTTVALIRQVGASGGYWVASATDHIIANRMSVTGSIGAIGSYLGYSGLIQRYNITYERLVAGEHKDLGIPYRELEDDEREILQNVLDKVHEEFIKEVAANRNLELDYVRDISTGLFYLGSEAKELGLIDELGGREEAVDYIEETLNITAEVSEYRKKKTFFEQLSEVFWENSFFIGRGLAQGLFDKRVESVEVFV
jgi:protease-4